MSSQTSKGKTAEPTRAPSSNASGKSSGAKSSGNGRADMMVNMNEMNVEAFNKACQTYLNSWATMNGEIASFLSKRFGQDAELSSRLASCSSLAEAATLQHEWAQEAAEEYAAEANKLVEMASKVASDSWQPMLEQAKETVSKAMKNNG